MEKVTTICYGKSREWENREEAVRFYLNCMACSEGSEHERYSNVLMGLMYGDKICTDGVN